MRVKNLLLAALVLLIPAQGQPSFAEARSPGKLEDIRKLLEITGSAQLGVQVMSQLIGQFKTTAPQLPDQFWREMEAEVNPDEITQRIIPIYDKYLSQDEVRAIIRFYETPAGKKMIGVLPQITQESMTVGQQWGREIGARFARKLAEQKQQQQKAPKK